MVVGIGMPGRAPHGKVRRGVFAPDDYQVARRHVRKVRIEESVVLRRGFAEAVIPIPREDFPRTTSGKKQRAQLRRRLDQGEFNESIRALQRHLSSGVKLPAWFFTPAWQRQAPTS